MLAFSPLKDLSFWLKVEFLKSGSVFLQGISGLWLAPSFFSLSFGLRRCCMPLKPVLSYTLSLSMDDLTLKNLDFSYSIEELPFWICNWLSNYSLISCISSNLAFSINFSNSESFLVDLICGDLVLSDNLDIFKLWDLGSSTVIKFCILLLLNTLPASICCYIPSILSVICCSLYFCSSRTNWCYYFSIFGFTTILFWIWLNIIDWLPAPGSCLGFWYGVSCYLWLKTPARLFSFRECWSKLCSVPCWFFCNNDSNCYLFRRGSCGGRWLVNASWFGPACGSTLLLITTLVVGSPWFSKWSFSLCFSLLLYIVFLSSIIGLIPP